MEGFGPARALASRAKPAPPAHRRTAQLDTPKGDFRDQHPQAHRTTHPQLALHQDLSLTPGPPAASEQMRLQELGRIPHQQRPAGPDGG